jgi:conjugative transfer signal peptidase TraF
MPHRLSLRSGEGSSALPAACGPQRLAGAWRRLRPLRLGLAWCGLCAGSALLWHVLGPPLLLNLTASVPRGIYRLTPLTTLTRGMLVVFPPPPAVAALLVTRGYLAPHTPLLKPVAALPGETVCVHDDGVIIQGVFVAPVASVDGLGRPLPRWRGCVRLGVGEVFPLSTWTPRSLDGRYVGPVRVGRLLGRAVPVWTWGVGAVRRGEGERGQDKDGAHTATLPLQNQSLGRHTTFFCVPQPSKRLRFQGVPRHTHAVAGHEGCDADTGR